MRNQIIVKHEIQEAEFYSMYFNMFNNKKRKRVITERSIDLLTAWCMKPMSFIIKKRSDNRLIDNKAIIAKELNVSSNQISNLIRLLIIERVVILNEEEEFVLNPNINILRKTIKENIENDDFNFNYILNFNIKKKK